MAGGLVALLDDVALIARTAAANIDDVSAMAGKTTAKTVGVVVDDAAVTPKFVDGVSPAREIPIIWRIAKGSLVNKLLIILPIALLLSSFAPWALTPLLMCGGLYLAFEGAEKIVELFGGGHAESHEEKAKDEDSLVKSAVMTDFILSAEIMVISLNEVADQSLGMRAAVLAIVGLIVTLGVYGVVGLLVKMDDIGLHLARQDRGGLQKFGQGMVNAMPKVLATIGVIGTFAMLWVGGHILLVGTDELGWHWPYHTVHHIVESIHHLGSVVQWIVETFFSMIFGLVAGFIIVGIIHLLPGKKH
ncbi:DUF808 domain-containing protein [Corynebacterium sp. 320]|uniref:DUF808 domain-containing protein n=1 Tax=Corynebacterium TaxID=1716 RepID=UPI00125CAE50|nr:MULTISPECIES: DUF808 domain-containing protein [Corynebacterium]KAB1503996.1 DUF808 domain-containing protein [Corynebacterium sp. 320]KAB1552905.1 DUF808 domain-containing protein [Corynebacterium sp. 321]KAB1553877.1 DUF808 domain-containing protein [Corynebacterium sp. 319]KAB3528132.1 DUF808 domain-containing protein [Corynebacterium sp. 250]KAB3540380.1 DUF808 domain-containing protein [Corynebacterium sp. 366]